MWRANLKITFRNLRKNKGFSMLNIGCLALGIACAGLIFLWVENELGWDKFNTKHNQLYIVQENQKYDNYTATFSSTPGVLAPAMQAEVPGVANTCRVYEDDKTLFTIGDKAVYASGIFADTSLLSMFTLPFAEGNITSAFKDPYSLVITQSAAKKLFGNETGIVGRMVRVANSQNYRIGGIIKDIPSNSSLQFEWMAPFQIIFEKAQWLQSWGNNSINTYVELQPGTNAASVNKILYNFIQQREPLSIARPFLWSMDKWHLYNQFADGVETGGGQIEYVRLFIIIAWIILLIACINFMNLATARSEKRAKEVGVRKVMGVSKGGLVAQFLTEALVMAFISAIISVIIILVALPSFNLLVEKNLSAGLNKPTHLLALLIITVVCGLIAGSYPSFYLSSFRPVFVLKGIKLKTSSASFVRKGLVILQFTISVVLIISTVVVYRQVQHVKSRNLGFNKNNLLEADAQGEVAKYFPAVKHELQSLGLAENVALSDHTTLYGGNNTGSLTWQGKPAGMQILISGREVTPGFINTSGMKLLQGRDLTASDSITSKTRNVIVTKSLQQLMGQNGAVGKTLWNEGDKSGELLNVIGVVDDYIYGNIYGKPDPVVFLCTTPDHTNKMYLRLKSNQNPEKALAGIEAVLKKYNPAFPFIYTFVDQQFSRMYGNETFVSKLSKIFAALAILISCLGLFGLAAFTAERRTKEIGVRKVLGASVSGITMLLSREFLQLVIISCLLAFPAAFYAMSNWLQGYQYRVNISWWIFALAGAGAICIAFVTVSFQAIKAATANPVKSLRSE